MISMEEYVYKKTVDWSLLSEGLTLPIENQVIFGRNMERFLQKGEKKQILLYLNGKSYKANVVNVNYSSKFIRNSDVLQIRYPKNGELAKELQGIFLKSYQYFQDQRALRLPGDRTMIKLPEDRKEYIAIYTTEYDDSYIIETIESTDILDLKRVILGLQERVVENDFNFEMTDGQSTIITTQRTVKIRKLNKKIGDNLKLLYGYRCQICGKIIGEECGSHVAESHHIEYFVNSLNNDSTNQMILCPNHHTVIHDTNPVFQRRKMTYIFGNGYEQKIILNKHL